MSGIFLSSRNLYLMLGGAAGTLALKALAKKSDLWRPAAVGAVKEGIAFKEWVATRLETFKEDVEDLVAEAAVAYQTEEAADSDFAEKEREILEKMAKFIDERLAEVGGKKGA
ncbi:hypothetical protein [Geoalkalibacter halelectricus]